MSCVGSFLELCSSSQHTIAFQSTYMEGVSLVVLTRKLTNDTLICCCKLQLARRHCDAIPPSLTASFSLHHFRALIAATEWIRADTDEARRRNKFRTKW